VPPNVRVGAPVHLVVRDPDHVPHCDTSTDPSLEALLTLTWRAVDGEPVSPVEA